MHDWRGVDFRDPLEYSLAQFCPGLNADVAQEGPCHFAKQRFDDVEPRSMLRCQHILEAIRACAAFLSRCVVEDQSNGAIGGVPRVQVFKQIDELVAAVPPFDAGGNTTVMRGRRRAVRAATGHGEIAGHAADAADVPAGVSQNRWW